MSDGMVAIQRKHGHRPALSAKQKGAVSFRIDGHSMIELATRDRILADYAICCRIDLSNLICAAQIDVNLPRDGVVLRHTCFTVESESLNNFVFININDCFRFAQGVGNVDFSIRRRIGASVRLGGGGKPLDNAHFVQIDNADLLLTPIGGVDLSEPWHIFESSDPRNTGDGFDQLVRADVDDIENARPEMCR